MADGEPRRHRPIGRIRIPRRLWRGWTAPTAGCNARRVGAARCAALVDVRPGVGAAGRAAGRDDHRAAVVYRVRTAVRPGDTGRRRLAQVADVRLADRPVVAVPAQSRSACRTRADPDPDRAGQTLVGDPAAVRVATGAVDRAAARTRLAADARRRDPVRDHHRRPEHPVRLHFRLQLLHGPLLRRLGLHRGLRDPHRHQDPPHVGGPAVDVDAKRAAHQHAKTPTRAVRTRRTGRRRARTRDDQPPRRPRPGRWWRPVHGGDHRGPDHRRLDPPDSAAAAAWTESRRRAERLRRQPDSRRGPNHPRPHRRAMAPHPDRWARDR